MIYARIAQQTRLELEKRKAPRNHLGERCFPFLRLFFTLLARSGLPLKPLNPLPLEALSSKLGRAPAPVPGAQAAPHSPQ